MRNQSGTGALRILIARTAGRNGMTSVPYKLRPLAEQMVMEATGATIEVRDNIPHVGYGGTLLDDDLRDVPSGLADQATQAIDLWCRSAHDGYLPLLPAFVPAGAERIVAALGYHPASALAMARTLYHLSLSDGRRTAWLSLGNAIHPRMTYRPGRKVRWENGTIEIQTMSVPNLVGQALAMQDVSAVVDDDGLAGVAMRHVSARPSLDNVLRITTTETRRQVRPKGAVE